MSDDHTAADAEADRRLDQLCRELGDEIMRKASARRWHPKRRRGRPTENHMPSLLQMMRIILEEGYNDIRDRSLIADIAREVHKTGPQDFLRRRQDPTKTLIKKYFQLLDTPIYSRLMEIVAHIVYCRTEALCLRLSIERTLASKTGLEMGEYIDEPLDMQLIRLERIDGMIEEGIAILSDILNLMAEREADAKRSLDSSSKK